MSFQKLNEPFFDEIKEKKAPNPIKDASFLQKLFFSWIYPLLKLGQSACLQQEMLYPIPNYYKAENLSLRFSKFWPYYKGKRAGLLRTLCRVLRKELFLFLFVWVLNTVFSFTNPMIINRVLTFAESESKPFQTAILLICLFIIAKIIQVLTITISAFQVNELGAYAITALSMKIFEKSMKFPLLKNKEYSEGKLVNMMQTDLMVLMYLFYNIVAIAFLPIQILIGLFMMYYYVDLAVLSGLAVVIMMSLLNYGISKIYMKFQEGIMRAKDERIKLTNEALQGIKYIKMNVFEHSFYQKIVMARKKELNYLMKQRAINICYTLVVWITPMLVTIFTFLVFIYIENSKIDSLKIFTVLSLFQSLSFSLNSFPYTVADMINCFISLSRIESFLLKDELSLSPNHSFSLDNNTIAIDIKNCDFYWENNNSSPQISQNNNNIIEKQSNIAPNLQISSFTIKKGSFVAIIGPIGSGKSSLFNAILREMRLEERSQSNFTVNGSVAYINQKAYAQNLTIKENILFGLDFEKEKYEIVKKMSCLDEEIQRLKHGDETIIGEKGAILSGGQKIRLNLARALYSNRDIYLMDDIFASIDSKIAGEILNECMLTHLKEKTRVLITNSLSFLPNVDYIYVMKEGKILEHGTFESLKSLAIFQETLEKIKKNEENEENEEKEENSNNSNKKTHELIIKNSFIESEKSFFHQEKEILPENETKNSNENQNDSNNTGHNIFDYNKIADDLIKEEDREIGRVKYNVIKSYVKYNGGLIYLVIVLIIMSIWQCLEFCSNLWLKHWIDSNDQANNLFYIKIYGFLTIAYAVCCSGRSAILFVISYFCSLKIHNNMIKSLLLAPINEFYDRVPTGRIVNRLSKDLYTVDMPLSANNGAILLVFFSFLTELGFCIYALQYWILIPFFILFLLIFKLQTIYMKSFRELVRLEAISKSPIVSYFTETLEGLTTIRAFSRSQDFIAKHARNLNENLKTLVIKFAFDEWFSQRVTFSTFILIISITSWTIFWDYSASFTGLLLMYAFQIESNILSLILSISYTEGLMISFERCEALTKIQAEKGYIDKEIKDFANEKIAAFPKISQGKIEFRNVDLKYQKNQDFILKKINFIVNPQEKIAVIGRTGVGKTTLFLSIMRVLETFNGEIIINDINVENLDLCQMRKEITFIPQDVYLFSGTLKENLDYDNEFIDETIIECLNNLGLKKIIDDRDGLKTQIKEKGMNFSVGEKHLLNLCRAFLKRNQIVLIDETTDNLDVSSEKHIHKLIKENFQKCTVLMILHRMSCIMEFDRVMVINKGEIVEFDNPNVLAQDKNSVFYELWQENNIKNQ